MKKNASRISYSKTLLFHILPLLGILLFCLPLILPYLKEGYFPTHDGEWAVVRLGDMYRELRDGQIPARFSGNLNFGYGYPLFNFAYPLPYYLGVGLLLLNFGLVNAIEILFVLSLLLGVAGMYLLSSSLWKSKLAGVVSAILYIYFPFRMVDLYVRGSLGDTLASACFPYILLCLYHIHTQQKKVLPSILAGVGFALLILAHNIMAVLFLLIAVPMMFVFISEKRDNWKWYVGSMMYGFLLSAFFWLPALLEKHFIALSQIPIADRNLYFVTLTQILHSGWGYAPPTEVAGFTYQIGWPQLIILVFSGVFTMKGLRNNSHVVKHAAIILVLVAVVCIIMMFRVSAFLWSLPLLSEINYPWLLLLPIGFVISLLAGYLVDQRVWVKTLVLLCAILAVVLYLPWAKPSEYVNRGDGFYLTNDATTTSSDELMPLWVKEKPKARGTKVELLEPEKGSIDLLTSSSKEITFISQLRDKATIQVNTIYFPGWEASIDGEKTVIAYDNPRGVMYITVPKGTHRNELLLKSTSTQTFANFLSITSLVFLPILVFLSKRLRGKAYA